jgi:dienelactone hydrolase
MAVAKDVLFELYFKKCRPRYVENNPRWQELLETLDSSQEKLLREEIKAALVAGFCFGAEAALGFKKNERVTADA